MKLFLIQLESYSTNNTKTINFGLTRKIKVIYYIVYIELKVLLYIYLLEQHFYE